jgi:hypothetical protein
VQREHAPDPEAQLIWHHAGPARGTVVAEYLERRGIPILPPTIRSGFYTHPGYEMPATVAAVQRSDGKVVAIQRTILTHNGEKASLRTPKITTGSLGHGAVRLAAAAESMGLAEGVETALSAQIMSEVPVWASLGSQRLDRVELPPCVRTVHIFGDNDEPGHAAADRTAAVHRRLDRKVVIHYPPAELNDFNDLLNADADDALRDLKTRVDEGSVAA